ncbi:MAG: catalase [Clostridium sp.]
MSHKRNEKDKYLTTSLGQPVSNDTSSLTVGERGPVLLQDMHFIDKMAHFDRERIPERVVHAKGSGAHGYFKLFNSMNKYTKAKIFNDTKAETPTFVRFSTVIGSKGSAETLRDPRGFAVKFYTEDGNFDIVGNNLPVFFIRDGIKFPDMVHAFKPSPDTNLTDNNRFWDFITNTPESTHMITFLFSDQGTVKNFRKMKGFGVNSYVWLNEKGERFFVKYHWIPIAGVETITRQEAELLAGVEPDVATKDLYNTLLSGKTVEYDLFVQIMDMGFEDKLSYDPLDATKVWSQKEFPLERVGRLTLTRPPSNFFEESEQVAFCPSNLVPGVELSNDKLLQGRSFSYSDTQRYRLGTNFAQLPINRPKVPVVNNQRDGAMAYNKHTGKVNYSPNSLNGNIPKPSPVEGKESTVYVKGDIVRKVINKQDNFTQAGELYRSFSKQEQNNLIDNIVNNLWEVDKNIQLKAIENFTLACREYGNRVKEGLKLNTRR